MKNNNGKIEYPKIGLKLNKIRETKGLELKDVAESLINILQDDYLEKIVNIDLTVQDKIDAKDSLKNKLIRYLQLIESDQLVDIPNKMFNGLCEIYEVASIEELYELENEKRAKHKSKQIEKGVKTTIFGAICFICGALGIDMFTGDPVGLTHLNDSTIYMTKEDDTLILPEGRENMTIPRGSRFVEPPNTKEIMDEFFGNNVDEKEEYIGGYYLTDDEIIPAFIQKKDVTIVGYANGNIEECIPATLESEDGRESVIVVGSKAYDMDTLKDIVFLVDSDMESALISKYPYKILTSDGWEDIKIPNNVKINYRTSSHSIKTDITSTNLNTGEKSTKEANTDESAEVIYNVKGDPVEKTTMFNINDKTYTQNPDGTVSVVRSDRIGERSQFDE